MAAVEKAGPSLKWVVLDMIPVTMIDATGLYTAKELADTLNQNGVVLAGAGRQSEWRLWAESRRVIQHRQIPFYPTIGEAIRAFQLGQENWTEPQQNGSAP